MKTVPPNSTSTSGTPRRSHPGTRTGQPGRLSRSRRWSTSRRRHHRRRLAAGILDRADVKAPRLQHGDGALTWILIEDAVRRGVDTRVGLEDTLYLPDGSCARNNADLVTAARHLGAGAAA